MFPPSDDEPDIASCHIGGPSAGSQHTSSSRTLSRSPRKTSAHHNHSHPAHSRMAGGWLTHLQEAIQARRERLGRQLRPLSVHSLFTGMGSHSKVMSATGLIFRDIVGAGAKQEAQDFLRRNQLLSEHHYKDAAGLSPHKVAFCCTCGFAHAPPDTEPDITVGGFDCQPFSTRAATTRPPDQHKHIDTFWMAITYLRAWKPRVAILENVMGFLYRKMHPDEEAPRNNTDQLNEHIGDLYHVRYHMLDLKTWVQASRPRLYLLLLRKDMFSQEIADSCCQIAREIEDHRKQTDAEPWVVHRLQPESPEYIMEVLGLHVNTQQTSGKENGTWKTLVEGQRADWVRRGHTILQSSPLEGASLRGLGATIRQRSVLEASLIDFCLRHGLSDTEEAKQGLVYDVSQNPGFTKATKILPTICCGSLIYDFEMDRLLVPLELMRIMGWSCDPTISTSDLRAGQLQELVGNLMALPSLAVALWSVLLAAGSEFPGTWSQ